MATTALHLPRSPMAGAPRRTAESFPPPATSHSRSTASPSAAKTHSPRSLTATALMYDSDPRSTRRDRPECISQTTTVPAIPPAARKRPSAENAMASARSRSPLRVATSTPDSASHRRTPSPHPATRRPSGDTDTARENPAESGRTAIIRPCSRSQRRTMSAAEAAQRPSGLMSTPAMCSEWPRSTCRQWPVDSSKIRSRRSRRPETLNFPSGDLR